MWTYQQSTGKLSHNGDLVGMGYSGHGAGVNNGALESDAGIGPIPRGLWIIGPFYDDPHLGPCVAHLDPVSPDDAHGRTLFRIHGDNAEGNESASRGCIIMNRLVRLAVKSSGDTSLQVIE